MIKSLCSNLCLVVSSLEAFSLTPSSIPRFPQHQHLSASSTLSRIDFDDGNAILNKARECAFGNDEVLALDASFFLSKLLELESDCSSGRRLGEDVCDITEEDTSMVEIVAQLRAKAELADSIRQKYLVHNMGVIVAMASVIFATSVWIPSHQDHGTPFTLQEIVWAAKGGYLDTMVMHWLRNGGL